MLTLTLGSIPYQTRNLKIKSSLRLVCIKVGLVSCNIMLRSVSHLPDDSLITDHVAPSQAGELPRKRKTKYSSNPPMESPVGWVMGNKPRYNST